MDSRPAQLSQRPSPGFASPRPGSGVPDELPVPFASRGDGARPLSLSSARLVGRDRELADLRGALSHRPSIVWLEGEAGVGKSRLLRECVAALQRRGTKVALGSCSPLQDPLPLEPVIHGLRYLVAQRQEQPQAALVQAANQIRERMAMESAMSRLNAEKDPAFDLRHVAGLGSVMLMSAWALGMARAVRIRRAWARTTR